MSKKLVILFLFVSSAFAQGLQMGSKGNVGDDLTDQQRLESQKYIHEGLSERKQEELCNKESDPDLKKACEKGEVDVNIAGLEISPVMGDAIVKAYTMIVTMIPGEFNTPEQTPQREGRQEARADRQEARQEARAERRGEDSNQEGSESENSESENQEDEKKEDYCKYIAIGTEAVAMVMQTVAQSNLGDIEPGNPNSQTEALYKSKRSMEERAKNAEFQTFGWGATTVCYGIMAFQVYTDWKVWVKLAGSGLITAYQVGVMLRNREYADKLGIMIKKMPKPGDCNPHTQRQCFCSQPETERDPTYCLPQGVARTPPGANYTKVACLDRKLKPDLACQCAMSNNCYDITHMSMVNGISFGEGAQEAVNDPMRQIARGTIPTTNLGSGALGNRAAKKARDLLNKYDSKLEPFKSLLNKNSQAQAKELVAFGLPKNAAIALSVQKKGDPKFQNRLAGFSNPSAAYARPSNYRRGTSGTFRKVGGGGFGNKNTASVSRANPMDKLFNKNKGGSPGVTSKIIGLAEKAERSAGITQHSDVNIFQIISRRYQLSGWKRVQFEQQ